MDIGIGRSIQVDRLFIASATFEEEVVIGELSDHAFIAFTRCIFKRGFTNNNSNRKATLKVEGCCTGDGDWKPLQVA